jgi:hypothetical protein
MKEEFKIYINASGMSLRKIIHEQTEQFKKHAPMHFARFVRRCSKGYLGYICGFIKKWRKK